MAWSRYLYLLISPCDINRPHLDYSKPLTSETNTMKRISDVAHVITAIGVIILASLALGGRLLIIPIRNPIGPGLGVSYATTTVSCKNGKQFIISTGNAAGACKVDTTSGIVTGGSCSDALNTTSADCSGNGGDGTCGNSTGSGSCTPK
jgi:hypothetical protein